MHHNPRPDRPRRAARWRRLLLLSGGVGLLAGCDARDPTAPATPSLTTPPSARRAELAQPLGHTYLAVPANSSPDAIAAIKPQDAGSVPDSVWVLIHVDGQITLTGNPDCAYAPPYWPCQTGPVAYPFGDLPSTGGPVNVWVQQGTSGGWTTLRGVGGANSNSAVGLHFQTRAGGIGAKLNLMPKWAWNPMSGLGPYSYSLSGGYDVNVTHIASPLQLDDMGVVDAAGTHRYVLQTTHGLQLINPRDWSWSWPAGAVHWYFFPGESVSEKPGTPGYAYELTSCRFQTSCNFAPPGPGRVQADAYVETRSASVRSRDADPCLDDGIGGEPSLEHPNLGLDVIENTTCILVNPPLLQVTCPTPVTRGDRSKCTAAVSPGTPDFIVLDWKYVGTTYNTQSDTVGDLKEWDLLPPVTGTVTVRAMVDGKEQTAETTIVVNDCDFFRDPVTDPRLLSPVLQAGLIDIARKTGWERELRDRLEHGGYVVATSGGGERWIQAAGSQNLCGMEFDPTQMAALKPTIRSQSHTHPTGGGPVSNPGNCLEYNATTRSFESSSGATLDLQSGPSTRDLQPWKGPNPHTWPGYVLEPRDLTMWEVDADKKLKKQRYRLNQGPNTCIPIP